MSCPICSNDETRVVRKNGKTRRRECERCGHRWNTVEVDKQRYEDETKAVSDVRALATKLSRPEITDDDCSPYDLSDPRHPANKMVRA